MALPPPGKFVKEDVYARRSWRRVQFLTDQFWSRWKREYLSNISQRQKWHTPKINLQVVDIIIARYDDIARSEWQLARVTEALEDADRLVRIAKLLMSNPSLDR